MTVSTRVMATSRTRAKRIMIPMFDSTFTFSSIGSVRNFVSTNSPRAIDRNSLIATMEFEGILTFHSVKNTMNYRVLIIPHRNFREEPRSKLTIRLPEAIIDVAPYVAAIVYSMSYFSPESS